MRTALHRFWQRLIPYAAMFVLVQSLLRLWLATHGLRELEYTPAEVAQLFARGFWLDLVTASFFLLPAGLALLCLPTRWQSGMWDRRIDTGLRFLFAYALLFDAVAEHLFWEEFSTRFNFIAVDYLIYTQEVIGNIVESYPLPALLGGIALGAALLAWLSLRIMPWRAGALVRLPYRAAMFAAMLALSALLWTTASIEQAKIGENDEASELAANGIYNLFYAFWHNEISYERFYAMEPEAQAEHYARRLLTEADSEFVHPEGRDLTRLVHNKGPEMRKNVILVVMESMSADYMGTFGNKDGLTPNLDRLARDGLFFADTYATGTRTVRGLEAVTLSIPPTPGQSILRRPGNDNLFSLGFVFRDRGYDTKFIYGGYGYFDNMNAFFAGNGFDVLDRTSMSKDETHFANIWGICDEDMFARTVREADASFAQGKPFMQLIMTTSNHRPFTYPDGRVDIPSHSGKNGGVKYADYSVGKLIEEARTKPWFKDTVFVFVADHTAGAGGKVELNAHKYHIPMIFYAPGFIAPRRFTPIASQIDLAPTLLGQLNFTYYTKFYGEDLLHDLDEVPHAFISNYQKVGLIREGELSVLSPKRGTKQYYWPDVERPKATEPDDAEEFSDAIAYYQSASWWRQDYRRIPTLAPQTTGQYKP